MITIQSVPLHHAISLGLWAEQQAELLSRYGEPDADADFAAHLPADGLITSLVALADDGVAVGTALARWSPFDTGRGSVEVKRLFVREGHRGRGYSRVLMGAIEAAALRAGAVRIVLETGTEQPEALGLYEAIGYHRITPYGEYKEEPTSVCFAKELPTRVLVLNGTIAAGKTATAAGVHDILGERGARTAYVDGDALCQILPASDDNPYGQPLLFENLAAVGPVYRHWGAGHVIIPRVVEDPEDRDRYAHAFGLPGLPAEVTIARVTASEQLRLERIKQREPEGYWQDWCNARTVELEAALDSYGLDDVVVTNEGRTARDTAEELVELIGW